MNSVTLFQSGLSYPKSGRTFMVSNYLAEQTLRPQNCLVRLSRRLARQSRGVRRAFSDVNTFATDCDCHGTDLIGPSPKAHAWLVISYHHYFSKTANKTKPVTLLPTFWKNSSDVIPQQNQSCKRASVPLLQAAKMSEAEFCLRGRVNSSSFNQSESTCLKH